MSTSKSDFMIEWEKERAAIRPRNIRKRTALIPKLAEKGIALAVATFDGSCDMGEIESITFLDRRNKELSIQDDLEKEFESLAYGVIEEKHSGWEIDAGAFGRVVLHVRDKWIKVEYYERQEIEYSDDVEEF